MAERGGGESETATNLGVERNSREANIESGGQGHSP